MPIRVELADLQNEADHEYNNYEIGLGEERPPLVLLPILRLPDDKIQQIYALHERLTDLNADRKNGLGGNTVVELRNTLHQILSLAAQDQEIVQQFLAEYGGDFVVLQKVFAGYMEATQPGEASASPNSSTNTAGLSGSTSPNEDSTS